MINPYLSALGADAPTVQAAPLPVAAQAAVLLQVVADPSVQPPRIYAAMRTGGGLVFQPTAAAELGRRGYAVHKVSLTSAEAAYLTRLNPKQVRVVGQTAFIASCSGRAHQSGKVVMCGPSPDLQVIEVVDPAKTPPQNLQPALQWVTRSEIGEVVVMEAREGTAGSTLKAAADQYLKAYDRIAVLYRRMGAYAEVREGARLDPPPMTLANVLARSQTLLAEGAQPVSLVRKGSANLWLPGTKHRYGLAVSGSLIITAVVAVSLLAALAYCASKVTEAIALLVASEQAALQFCEMAAADMKNQALPQDVRQAAKELYAECEDLVKPPGSTVPWEALAAATIALAGAWAYSQRGRRG